MNSPVTRVPVRPTAGPARPDGAGRTHVGLVRKVNEDAILTDPSGALWAVSDGMGGHGHGDIAADIVIDSLSRLPHDGDPQSMLTLALEDANAEIFNLSRREEMGTVAATVVAVMISGTTARIAWVGDSRAYLLHDGNLRRLTRDHSLVQEMVDAGTLAPDQAENHPQANVVTRGLGAAAQVEVAFTSCDLSRSDILMLCSDGLSKSVSEQDIARLLLGENSPEAACAALIRAALEAGGPDNVSVVVVFMDGPGT